MQIVIEIDDDDYQFIQDTEFENYVVTQHLYEAVYEGKPLPKGHGRLIDVSNLLTVTDIREDGSEFTYVPYSEIEDAPTIIEADEED